MDKKTISGMFESCPELLTLHQTGKLDKIKTKFPNAISEKNYLGGKKCSVFMIPEKRQVLKIYPRNICYFRKKHAEIFMRNCGSFNVEPLDFFKAHVNSLNKFFCPIIDIVYHDENIFAYTQEHLPSLKKFIQSHEKPKKKSKKKKDKKKKDSFISASIFIQILEMIKYTIENNVLIYDLSWNNLVVVDKNILISDYDMMKPLHNEANRDLEWWSKQLGVLLVYLCQLYQPDKLNWFRAMKHNWNHTTLEQVNYLTDLFPPIFISLIKAYVFPSFFRSTDEQLHIICKTLDQCIYEVKNRFK